MFEKVCSFIIIEKESWMVGDDITGNRGLIASEMTGLTIPPKSGWKYADGRSWMLDDTLLFLPGVLSLALDDNHDIDTLNN